MQVVNPFDGIQTGSGSEWKFFAPAIPRETLKSSILRWQKSSLHDGDALHRVSNPR
jgi:hypothetical protein